MNCIVFGEVLWDVYPDKSVIGGAPFNFAANLSLLGHNVSLITGIGHDELGEKTLGCIGKYGIDTTYVSLTDKNTGECRVTLDENAIPSYDLLTDTAYDNIELSDELINKLNGEGVDIFYFNTLSQRSPVSRKTLHELLERLEIGQIMCDLNIRKNCYDKESIILCLSRADIVKISDEEAHFLADTGALSLNDGEDIFAALHRQYKNISLLVYTMGGEGSRVYDFRDGKMYSSGKPERVEVVSTVGAGDCYGASFLAKYLDGSTIDEAIAFAAKRSSIVVANTEAIPECFAEKR